MDTADLVAFSRFGRIQRYSHFATYTAFVYDWLLCLGDEIDMLSTPGPALAKLAYISCRYFVLLSYPMVIYVQGFDHDRSVCERTFRIPMLMGIPYLGLSVSILTLRLYAFTGGRVMLVFIIVACFLVISAYHTWVVFAKAILSPTGRVCAPVAIGNASNLGSIFLGALLLDTLITIAFITHFVRSMKLRYGQTSAITRTFLRQGVLYFIAISTVNLLNVAFNVQPYQPMADINVPFSFGLPSLLACRMVLDLRNVGISEDASRSGVLSDRQTAASGLFSPKTATSTNFVEEDNWAMQLSPRLPQLARDRASVQVRVI